MSPWAGLAGGKNLAPRGIRSLDLPSRRSSLYRLIYPGINIMFTLKQTTKAQRARRHISTLSLTSAIDGGGWSTPRPGRFIRGKDSRYSRNRRLGGPQGPSGRLRKISLTPGFDPPNRPARSESLYRLSNRSQENVKKFAVLFWRKAGYVFQSPAGINNGE